MARPTDARDRLLRTAFELVWSHSFAAVSVDDICQQAGVQKGSFYHFFRSKADLAWHALEAWWRERRPELDAAFSPTVPPMQRLLGYLRQAYQLQRDLHARTGHVLGCPLLTLGTEMSLSDSPLRAKVAEIEACLLKYLETAVSDAARAGQVRVDDPVRAARALHALKNGLSVEARIHNDPERLRDLTDLALRLLDATPVAAEAAA